MSAMQLSLAQAQKWITGARLVGAPDALCARVHTDTRSLQPGDLFVALRGERFDAHDFLPQAQVAGARAAVEAIAALQGEPLAVTALQDMHA